MRARLVSEPAGRRRALLGLEYFFLIVGLIAVDSFIWVTTSTTLYQAYQDWAFDQSLRGLSPTVGGFVKDEFAWLYGGERTAAPVSPEASQTQPLEPLPKEKPPAHAMLIGRLEIPRLRLKAMVREGADEGTLRRAVGHIPGTALPGNTGNVALAGHRDTFFRELRNIRKNDSIDVQTENGTYKYEVQSTKIVGPRDVGVLAPTGRDSLTLVTCYPFYYVGSAPKRFIVHATQVAAVPTVAATPQHQQQRGS